MAKRFSGETEGLRIQIYGHPGSGKTWLSASCCDDPRYGNVLMLEARGNPQSLNKKEGKKPDIISMLELVDFNDPYNWFMNDQPENDSFAKEFDLHPPYNTLIVDGTTEAQRFMISKITGSDKTDPGNLTNDLGRQGFGRLLGTTLNWSVHYIDLSKEKHINFILTCNESNKTDADSGIVKSEPLIWGAGGRELSGYVLMVLRLSQRLSTDGDIKAEDDDVLKETTINVAQFKDTKRVYAKDQYGCGVTHLVNPTMTKVMDLIERSS